MAVLMSLAVGVLLGFILGGWSSLRHARSLELLSANRALRRGAVSAFFAAMVSAFVLLGWPWKASAVSVPHEVTRTVMETVAVVVEAPWYLFWASTQTEMREVPKEITETILRTEDRRSFSLWLLIPLGLLGLAAAWVELAVVRFWYRWLG